MHNLFEMPELNVIRLEIQDVITTSTPDSGIGGLPPVSGT